MKLTSDDVQYCYKPSFKSYRKTSSSRDARKMYGDIIPGDTTHQDVVLLYHNYFKTAHRSLPREKDKGKYEVWEMISTIIWVCTMIIQFVNPSYTFRKALKETKMISFRKLKQI